MPLILDNILVFLWRLFAHFFRTSRSQVWPSVAGKIENIDCPEREMYPYAEIHYSYKVADAEFDARCLRGFWYDSSARDFTNRYAGLNSLKVRYAPENPTQSYILDEDQDFSNRS
jgi:Protein of unknown function (DUF3592)